MRWTFMSVFLVACTTFLTARNNLPEFLNQAGRFFEKHVKNGLVDYSSIQNTPAELPLLIEYIQGADLQAFGNDDQRKAFLINAYNILVIYSVIREYPIKSPMDVGGFFNRRKYIVAGNSLTLDDLEKKQLFGEHPDPRFHFVLVCAARGCPRMIPAAYRPAKLSQQLDERTRKTLNDDFYVRIDRESQKVYISEIFKWYERDFRQAGQTVIQYINRYRNQAIPQDYSIRYIPYDWTLNDLPEETSGLFLIDSGNLQAYTPSTLLRRGQVELKLFNNLYTQTAIYDENGEKVEQNSRSSFFTAILNTLVGLSPRINVGVDVYLKSVRIDERGSSALEVFTFSSGNSSRIALSSIGPKIKLTPFESIPTLAIQTTFLFPAASDLEGGEDQYPFLDVEQLQWWTQIFYDRFFASKFLIYFEGGLLLRLDTRQSDFITPLKAILNFYPSSKWTVYLPLEASFSWDGLSWASYFSQVGGGLKYQLTSNLELEGLYTLFPAGKSSGAGQTFNLGIRFIR